MKSLTRRQVLLGGTAGLMLIPLAYTLRVSLGGYKQNAPLEYLNNREFTVAAALASALLGHQPPFSSSYQYSDSALELDKYMSVSSESERAEISLLLWFVEYGLPPLFLKFQKFSSLSESDQLDVLRRLNNSQLGLSKLLMRGLKSLVCFGIFSNEESLKSIGIKGWCGP